VGQDFFITYKTYNLVKDYLKVNINTQKRIAGSEHYGDVTFGLWVREINRANNHPIKLISDWINLNIGCHKSSNHAIKALTFHYVKSETQFKIYDKFKYVFSAPDLIKLNTLNLETYLTLGSMKGTMMRHYGYKLLENNYDENSADFIFIIHNSPSGHLIESKNYPKHFITPIEGKGIYIKEDSPEDNKWQIEKYNNAFKFKSLSQNPKFKDKYLAFVSNKVALTATPQSLTLYFI